MQGHFFLHELYNSHFATSSSSLVKTRMIHYCSNHRLESEGLNALEELLFKILGIEKMVMRALF